MSVAPCEQPPEPPRSTMFHMKFWVVNFVSFVISVYEFLHSNVVFNDPEARGSTIMASSRRESSSKATGRASDGPRIKDPRFESMQKSSLYRRPSNKRSRVVVDKRFAPMLTDERFSSKAKVDRYGRKLQTSVDSRAGKANAELSKLYRIETEDGEEAEQADVADDDDEVAAELSRINGKLGEKGYDPARDGGYEESSSSEEDSEDDVTADREAEDDLDSPLSDEDKNNEIPEGEVSHRLAVVNLDWDYIRAKDLFAVFSSYATNGVSNDKVESVKIYPSEFGKERMEREEMEGPPKELFAGIKVRSSMDVADDSQTDSDGSETSQGNENGRHNGDEDDEDEDERIRKSLLEEDNGEEFSSSKLRNYQLERMRYFYAVVTCSTSRIAKEIYDNVDGREYLSSANFFDLRFIPDEVDFSTDKPREECSKLSPGYRPKEFVTAALQHSKVKLTWDEEDPDRKEIQERAFSGSRKDIDENELRAYLASDNSSDDEALEDQEVEVIDSTREAISRPDLPNTSQSNLSKAERRRREMRAKLGLKDEPTEAADQTKPVGDMQITFAPGLSTAENNQGIFENEPNIEETTAEKYIRKERERKARRKEKMKAEKIVNKTDTLETSAAGDDDKGFDDSFFTSTAAEAEDLAQQKKADKKKQRRVQRIAQEKDAAAETAELERVLKSNTRDDGVSHFSLSALEKAEKASRKQKLKKGKSRLSQSEKAALEARAQDDFEMNVEDSRFAAVYDRPEFALDPSHPRFRDTGGMKSLLQESRKRRNKDIERDMDLDPMRRRKKSRT